MAGRALVLVLILATLAAPSSAVPAERQVSSAPRQVAVWYRGTPQGEPLLEDLAAIRAIGFTAIVWPPDATAAGDDDVRRMAAVAGLSVLTAANSNAATSDRIATIPVVGKSPDEVAARAWRLVQQGARIVAFDPGEARAGGSGLQDGFGQLRAWVVPARTIARQLSVNAALFEQLQAGPPLSVQTDASDLQVDVFQTPRSWVLFATSRDPQPRRVEASLPPEIPAALWISLLDGSGMSMLSRPAGPLWTTEVPAYGVQIYVIDKTVGGPQP